MAWDRIGTENRRGHINCDFPHPDRCGFGFEVRRPGHAGYGSRQPGLPRQNPLEDSFSDCAAQYLLGYEGGGFIRSGWHHRGRVRGRGFRIRSEEHTSELQSLMRISYAVFCLKKKITYLAPT